MIVVEVLEETARLTSMDILFNENAYSEEYNIEELEYLMKALNEAIEDLKSKIKL